MPKKTTIPSCWAICRGGDGDALDINREEGCCSSMAGGSMGGWLDSVVGMVG